MLQEAPAIVTGATLTLTKAYKPKSVTKCTYSCKISKASFFLLMESYICYEHLKYQKKQDIIAALITTNSAL